MCEISQHMQFCEKKNHIQHTTCMLEQVSCSFQFQGEAFEAMVEQLVLMLHHNLSLQICVGGTRTYVPPFFPFPQCSLTTSANEHEFADLSYVTNFNNAYITASTTAAFPLKNSLSAGLTDSNVFLSFMLCSSSFRTDELDLSKFSTVWLLQSTMIGLMSKI